MAKTTRTSEAEILTIRQVADYLQVTERTIYRLAAASGIRVQGRDPGVSAKLISTPGSLPRHAGSRAR